MTDHDTPTVAPPPPPSTIPPPPDYDALVDSPIVRNCTAEPTPSPYAGLADMVRDLLIELAEEPPDTKRSRNP
jgi:hypothetical protein